MTRSARCSPMPKPVPHGVCDAVQGHVCRMAADAPLSVAATAVARHIRECETCNEFVDELGSVRRWLREAPRPRQWARADGGVESIARLALSRELLARFARDLLATARGKEGRSLEEKERDRRRLRAVTEGCSSGLGTTQADVARVDLALQDGPIEAVVALEAAAHLDPLGLDIALAWLGSLERAGKGKLAHQLTDEMLARLG